MYDNRLPASRRFSPCGDAVGLRVARLCAAAVLLAGCTGPLGPIHGGRLAGLEVTRPVQDWSFAEQYRLMQIEARLMIPTP
jgi:hypothetical protein